MTLDELLTKHNYVVRIQLIDDGFLQVNYPNQTVNQYVVYDEEHTGVVIKDLASAKEEALDLPRTLIRLYILCDIYRQCKLFDLSLNIVRFFNKDGISADLVSLLPMEMDENEREAERNLQKYVAASYTTVEKTNRQLFALEKLGLLHQGLILRGLLV